MGYLHYCFFIGSIVLKGILRFRIVSSQLFERWMISMDGSASKVALLEFEKWWRLPPSKSKCDPESRLLDFDAESQLKTIFQKKS